MADGPRKYTLHVTRQEGSSGKGCLVVGDRVDMQSIVTGILLGAWDEVDTVPWETAGIILDFTDALPPGEPQKHELPRGRALSVVWEYGEVSG